MGSDSEVPYPSYWKCPGVFEFNDLEPVDSRSQPFFQQLLNDTHVGTWTRDRRKHGEGKFGERVPKQYHVVSVKRNENSKAWRAYAIRRAHLLEQCRENPPAL